MNRDRVEQPRPPGWFTLPLVIVASILWFLALGLVGAASGADIETPHQHEVINAQFWLATFGLIAAWLARIWSRQGHTQHATAAAVLAPSLFIAAIIVVSTA